MKKSIIYYTNNNVPEPIGSIVQKHLASTGLDIVSVSHYPMDFGRNICVGPRKGSIFSIYCQIATGLDNTDADVVYLAEHDCLYVADHWKVIPEDPTKFYYNYNVRYLNWIKGYHRKGIFTWAARDRKALSQLVAYRVLLRKNLEWRINYLLEGKRFPRKVKGAIEPGVIDEWGFVAFKHPYSNLDIRHERNFSGGRRGRRACREIPYWGTIEDIENQWT